MLDKMDQVKVDTDAQQKILIIFIPSLGTETVAKKKKTTQIACLRVCSEGISPSFIIDVQNFCIM